MRFTIIASTLTLVFAGTALGGTLDPSFAPVLRDFGSSADGFSSAQISVVQPDGKIAATLPPGAYTALLSGVDNTTGVGVVEVYDRGIP